MNIPKKNFPSAFEILVTNAVSLYRKQKKKFNTTELHIILYVSRKS
jgi:hypothetical protein